MPSSKPSRPAIATSPRGPALLCLALLLNACASSPLPPPVHETERVNPPLSLVQACPVPRLQGETNEALLRWAEALLAALVGCNEDKASIREWMTSSGER